MLSYSSLLIVWDSLLVSKCRRFGPPENVGVAPPVSRHYALRKRVKLNLAQCSVRQAVINKFKYMTMETENWKICCTNCMLTY